MGRFCRIQSVGSAFAHTLQEVWRRLRKSHLSLSCSIRTSQSCPEPNSPEISNLLPMPRGCGGAKRALRPTNATRQQKRLLWLLSFGSGRSDPQSRPLKSTGHNPCSRFPNSLLIAWESGAEGARTYEFSSYLLLLKVSGFGRLQSSSLQMRP